MPLGCYVCPHCLSDDGLVANVLAWRGVARIEPCPGRPRLPTVHFNTRIEEGEGGWESFYCSECDEDNMSIGRLVHIGWDGNPVPRPRTGQLELLEAA